MIAYPLYSRPGIIFIGSGVTGTAYIVYDAATKTLINYTTKDGLCNNQLWRIIEDEKGNLYFNTKNGISKYDGKTFTTLKPVKSTSPDKGWRLDRVTCGSRLRRILP
jgi:hypothetical protein